MTPPLPHADHILVRLRTIAQVIMRSQAEPCEADDLISAGWIGFSEAWKRGKKGKVKYLETYALCRAEGAMRDEIRQWNGVPWYPVKVPVSLAQLTEELWERFSDPSSEDEDTQTTVTPEAYAVLQCAIETLTRREKETVRLAYIEDLPLPEVAARMHISMSGVYVYRWAALQKLRAFFVSAKIDYCGNENSA